MFYIACFAILIGLGYFCHKYGYSSSEQRAYVNSKHPDWSPFCGRNFLKEDPQWFIQNGYGKYVD